MVGTPLRSQLDNPPGLNLFQVRLRTGRNGAVAGTLAAGNLNGIRQHLSINDRSSTTADDPFLFGKVMNAVKNLEHNMEIVDSITIMILGQEPFELMLVVGESLLDGLASAEEAQFNIALHAVQLISLGAPKPACIYKDFMVSSADYTGNVKKILTPVNTADRRLNVAATADEFAPHFPTQAKSEKVMHM